MPALPTLERLQFDAGRVPHDADAGVVFPIGVRVEQAPDLLSVLVDLGRPLTGVDPRAWIVGLAGALPVGLRLRLCLLAADLGGDQGRDAQLGREVFDRPGLVRGLGHPFLGHPGRRAQVLEVVDDQHVAPACPSEELGIGADPLG